MAKNVKECIDCGAEVLTRSPRCEPCREVHYKERAARNKKEYLKRHPPELEGKPKKRCLGCFSWFTQNMETQRFCRVCSKEDNMTHHPKRPTFREPLGCWLSNKPITMNYWDNTDDCSN